MQVEQHYLRIEKTADHLVTKNILDSTSVKVFSKINILNTWKQNYNIQAEQVGLQVRQAVPNHLDSRSIESTSVKVFDKRVILDTFKYSYFDIQAEQVCARHAVDCQPASNGIEFIEKIKARDVNTSEHLGDNGSVINPWEMQRKKFLHTY